MLSSYKIIEYINAKDFLQSCESLLLSNESFYNLKLGLASLIKDNKLEASEQLYFGVFQGDKLIGCALRTNFDKPMALTQIPYVALEQLVNFLANKNIALAGVVGEIETSTNFKEIWTSKNLLKFKINIHLGVYEANSITPPNVNGSLIQGTENEYATIFEFVKGFSEDCFPDREHKNEDIQKICERHIKNRSLYLLKDNMGMIVSMAANTRGSLNGGTVSLVYTPKHLRGHGYGSLVTALVTEKILTEKKFANLFTDLQNPTSNSIYQKIGENIHFDFCN
jgi:hypothetical protein